MLSEENIKIKKKDTRNLKICVANCGNYSKKYRNLNLYVASSFEDTVSMKQYFVAQKTDFIHYQSCFNTLWIFFCMLTTSFNNKIN